MTDIDSSSLPQFVQIILALALGFGAKELLNTLAPKLVNSFMHQKELGAKSHAKMEEAKVETELDAIQTIMQAHNEQSRWLRDMLLSQIIGVNENVKVCIANQYRIEGAINDRVRAIQRDITAHEAVTRHLVDLMATIYTLQIEKNGETHKKIVHDVLAPLNEAKKEDTRLGRRYDKTGQFAAMLQRLQYEERTPPPPNGAEKLDELPPPQQ